MPWSIATMKINTLQIVAHEIGHNLNMAHDFINNTPGQTRRDRNGNSCTNRKAVMDYYQVIKEL